MPPGAGSEEEALAQVKKPEVRDAILASADELFGEKGYAETTVAEIGRAAGVSASNIYVYFDSKLAILYAICEPWLRARIERLGGELAALERPEARLRLIFRTLWLDLPGERNGFANNLMQALSTTKPSDTYSRELLLWSEAKLTELIRQSLPPERAALVDGTYLAHIVFMAFDGFAINYKLKGPSERIDGMVELMIALLLGRPAVPRQQK